jgi:hypothetical protein
VAKAFDAQLTACQSARDEVAAEMKSVLGGAIFSGARIDFGQWHLIRRGQDLIEDMHALSRMATAPGRLICRARHDARPL